MCSCVMLVVAIHLFSLFIGHVDVPSVTLPVLSHFSSVCVTFTVSIEEVARNRLFRILFTFNFDAINFGEMYLSLPTKMSHKKSFDLFFFQKSY